MSLRAASPLVKSVAFTDADGKPVVGGATLNFVFADDKVTQIGSFGVAAKTESIGIKVVHYEKVEAVKVVVDSETGVGP